MIRFVASDLDGTILLEDATATVRTRAAIASLAEAGILFAICTARAPRSTVPIAEDLGLTHGYAICNSGGTVIDLATGAVAHHHPFDPDAARAMVSELRSRAPGVAFSGYVNELWHREPHYVIGATLFPTAPPVAIGDAMEFLAGDLTKMSIRHETLGIDELHSHVAGAVAELGLSHSISRAGFIEVLGPGIDKAAGVAWVAQQHRVAASETIAFGDDRPDIPMLAWAGRGVAVANAHPDVLSIADEICGPVEADGVAEVLATLPALADRSVSSSEDRR